MVLFINACARSSSRTRRLADRLLARWNLPVKEVDLNAVRFPVAAEPD